MNDKHDRLPRVLLNNGCLIILVCSRHLLKTQWFRNQGIPSAGFGGGLTMGLLQRSPLPSRAPVRTRLAPYRHRKPPGPYNGPRILLDPATPLGLPARPPLPCSPPCPPAPAPTRVRRGTVAAQPHAAPPEMAAALQRLKIWELGPEEAPPRPRAAVLGRGEVHGQLSKVESGKIGPAPRDF